MSAIAGLMSAFGGFPQYGPRSRRHYDEHGRKSSKSGQAGHKRREPVVYLKGYGILGHPIYAESRVSPMRRTPFHGRIKSIMLRDIITGR